MEERGMKKTYEIQYRLKLTDFELRVMVNTLNAYRLKQKEAGKDTTYLCNMILRMLDELDSIQY